MPIHRVSPREAKELMDKEGYVYIDVRSSVEYEQGHPEGSFNVPIAERGADGMVPNPDFVAVMEANFSRDTKLVVGCQAGVRSLRAIAALEQAGYCRLVDQRAGFGGVRDPWGRVVEQGWAEANLGVQTGANSERGYIALRKKLQPGG